MTEFNPQEAESLIDVMNLAKQRAHAQAERLSPAELDTLRAYISDGDPRVVNIYETHFDDDINDVIKAIGRDSRSMGIVEFSSLSDAYEEAHEQEWNIRVQQLLKGE